MNNTTSQLIFWRTSILHLPGDLQSTLHSTPEENQSTENRKIMIKPVIQFEQKFIIIHLFFIARFVARLAVADYVFPFHVHPQYPQHFSLHSFNIQFHYSRQELILFVDGEHWPQFLQKNIKRL